MIAIRILSQFLITLLFIALDEITSRDSKENHEGEAAR